MPHLGDLYVDLGTVSSATMDTVYQQSDRVAGVKDTEDRVRFQRRVARRFGRFAYPDELNPVMKPLRDLVRSKANSSNSPLGQALDRVVLLRMEALGGWEAGPPWSLNLLVVLQVGELPTLDELEDLPPAILPRQLQAGSRPNEVAEFIRSMLPGDPRANAAWSLLGQALANEMNKRSGLGIDILAAVTSEVLDTDELTFTRYDRSVDIDLDDLSDAT